SRHELSALPARARRSRLIGYLRAAAAQALRISPADVSADHDLLQLGIDSLGAIELQHRLERELAPAIPRDVFLSDRCIDEIAEHVVTALSEALTDPRGPGASPEARGSTGPLSRGQQALWFLHQIVLVRRA